MLKRRMKKLDKREKLSLVAFSSFMMSLTTKLSEIESDKEMIFNEFNSKIFKKNSC